jgi:hypothetical protein
MMSTFSRLSTWVSGAAMSTTLFAAATPAYSAAITGDLNFGGSLIATSTTFDFLPAGGGNGNFTISEFSPPNTGFFSTLNNTTGKIADFSNLTIPIATPVSFANFLTFDAAPTVSFTLTSLPAGTTSPLLPTTFTQVGTGVTASFSVFGFFVDSASPGERFDGVGNFSTQFNNTTVEGLLDQLNSGGSVSATYSASFTSVPEPEMLPSILGLGMAVAGAVALRRRVVAIK